MLFNEPATAISTTTAIGRRWVIGSFLTGTTTTISVNSNASTLYAAPTTDVSQRLQTLTLKQPTIGETTYMNMGNDMTVYPAYMEGTWDVTQTLVNVETPMGLQYAGGPNGLIDIARKGIQESKAQIGKPVQLQLRYIRCIPKSNVKSQRFTYPSTTTATAVVLEDRLYNTRQRLNQFAGTTVVANVQYADTKASKQEVMNALYEAPGPTSDVPLSTTLTYFKGPAAQKVFVLGHHDPRDIPNETDDAAICSSWTGYEYQRSIFALTNGSTAPPITTDTELIFQFTPVDCITTTTSIAATNHTRNIHHIRAKLRIAGYLNPNDKYYFDVQNRAVTIQDYLLDMKRVVS